MKKSRKFLIFCLLATAVCGIGYLVFYLGLLGHNEATYEKVQKIAWEDRGEALRPGTVIPIDFEALKEINPDVYAWIHIFLRISSRITIFPVDQQFLYDRQGGTGYIRRPHHNQQR